MSNAPPRQTFRFLRWVNDRILVRLGFRVVRTASLHPWQRGRRRAGPSAHSRLPDGAADYLRNDNERLVELRGRYARCDTAVTDSVSWPPDKVSPQDLLYFRGDNGYIWQVRSSDFNELAYALSYYHFAIGDTEGFLGRLSEDGCFGVHLFEIDSRPISRDLIDSAREIQFLVRHARLGLTSTSVLDIGAGYGRLAYRLHELWGDRIQVLSTDAFPTSTFISEYYLRFRGLDAFSVIPLDEIDSVLARTAVDLAVAVHSFTECTPSAVAWWLTRLAANDVHFLFVVANAGPGNPPACQGSDGTDLGAIFEYHGYTLRVCEPRHTDPLVQTYGIDPVWLYLFERDGGG